jgi:hypothetical protein
LIAKKTVKNQITLPKRIIERFPGAEYFEVTAEKGKIVLRPLELDPLGSVQRKLAELGLSERDVAGAVRWARTRGR